MQRQLLQDHLDLRAVRELEALPAGRDQRRVQGRGRVERALATVSGTVTVRRLACRAPGRPSACPACAALSLPAGRHSHGLRRLAACEAVRGSYDTAKAAIDRRCGPVAGKRQAEQLVQAAAADIGAFCQQRAPVPCTSEVLLVLSAGGKGIVMRPEGLRPATRKAAACNIFRTRLACGESRAASGWPPCACNLIGAAARGGAAFVLVSVVGAAPAHPIGLFRAKHAAEQTLRVSGIPWTIVRATAFIETWATLMDRTLQASGKILVFGRGDNPVNFVSTTDVAALVELAAADPGVRGQVLQIGGPGNLTFNQVAALLQEAAGRTGKVQHIPRPALQAIATLARAINPALSRQARAALAMDTLDMTFDATAARRSFPGLPNTDMPSALKELLA